MSEGNARGDDANGESVRVTFRLYGLGRQLGVPSGAPFSREYRHGTTVEEALHDLGVRHEAEVSVLVRGRAVSAERWLEPDDELVVIPPLVGGS
jgi:hypothetical protein